MPREIFLDKAAGEKLLSLWWFFALAVIGGGIVMGVIIYYSADTNTNSLEGDILLSRLSNCFGSSNHINPKIMKDDFDIFYSCNLDSKMFRVGSFLYFNATFYNSSGLIRNFSEGNFAFENDCRVAMKVSSTNFPKCFQRNYSFLGVNGEQVQINIIGGSNQVGSKTPLA